MMGGVTPASVIREILSEGGGHFARTMVQRRSAMHVVASYSRGKSGEYL